MVCHECLPECKSCDDGKGCTECKDTSSDIVPPLCDCKDELINV